MKKYFILIILFSSLHFYSCTKCGCVPGPGFLLTIEYLNKDGVNLFSSENISLTEDIRVYFLHDGATLYQTEINGKGYNYFENQNRDTLIGLFPNQYIRENTSTTIVQVKEFKPDTLVATYDEGNQVIEFLINGSLKYVPNENKPLVLGK